MNTRTEFFLRQVRDHMSTAPVQIAPETPIQELVQRMKDEEASAAVVLDSQGHAQGIITERDVTHRIACQMSSDMPAKSVMSAPVVVVHHTDYLYHAIAHMRRRRLRHIPVVNDSKRICGMLALHDALAFLSGQTMDLIDRLTHEESIEGLKKVKQAQLEVAESLLEDNVPVPEVQSLLTEINFDIHRRIVRRTLMAMEAHGWGQQPVKFAVIIMGSGGRRENFLSPDQDNGFIIDDYPDEDHTRIDTFFIELADRMTEALDEVGIRFCRGNIMATNPVWRKTLSQWRKQIAGWMRRRNPTTLRLSDIFFDFDHVFGEQALSLALREFVTELVARNQGFIKDMFSIEAEHKVALGWFGQLVSERDKLNRSGMINLKYGGTLPLVEAIRLLSLKHGVPETSTLARIRALHKKNALDVNEQDYLTDALQHITRLLLRQQIEDFKAGREVGNYVAKKSLPKREKDYLVAGLRAIDNLRGELKSELSGEGF